MRSARPNVRLAAEQGIDPTLQHRVAVMSAAPTTPAT
jgi:hypothetical protein